MDMHKRIVVVVAVFPGVWAGAVLAAAAQNEKDVRPTSLPAGAKFACPMERHPGESDAGKRGAYFSTEPGKCPRCGMTLKPIDALAWAKARQAAGGGDVAYTCPDHPHVFSTRSGECPRCGKPLHAFKVMYTCRNPDHADVIRTSPGSCPHCGQRLVPFRGVWLDETMARANVPPNPGPAGSAPFHCPNHRLVHSGEPGRCTICAAPLVGKGNASTQPETGSREIPADAKYACPMKECRYFSSAPGECPKCGMRLKGIKEIGWARERMAKSAAGQSKGKYVCPMHPDQVKADKPGLCPLCAMRLVPADAVRRPRKAPAQVAAQIDYITEHYLALQKLLASDRTKGVALHTLGLLSASEEAIKHLNDPSVALRPEVKGALVKLRAAALKIKGTSLQADRVAFVDLSAAMRTLVQHLRPDKKRWPKLYIFHCSMSKGDWVQSTETKANPYYGFKMLTCGVLQQVE